MKRTPQTNAGSLQAMGYLGFLAHNTTSSSTPPPFRGPWLWPAMWGTAFLPLAAASGCSWAPLPGDEDFRDGPPTVERRFTRCAVALDAAGGHQSGLFQTLAFGAAPDVSVFSGAMCRAPLGDTFGAFSGGLHQPSVFGRTLGSKAPACGNSGECGGIQFGP
ncbi:unnamed protein product [Effrenium voratum]|nr:unnamed protein product [Effrenium voratum]